MIVNYDLPQTFGTINRLLIRAVFLEQQLFQ
jgi:hypothetical protein